MPKFVPPLPWATVGDELDRALAAIETAFADAPRPPNDALLHERCLDDGDIAALYPIAHWRDVPDEVVEREYAALSFLSPAGFRHFIPAYMRFALRRLHTGAAAVDSTIWSLAPGFYREPELRDFTVSKLAALDGGQRRAVIAFLDAVRARGDDQQARDAGLALGHWGDDRTGG